METAKVRGGFSPRAFPATAPPAAAQLSVSHPPPPPPTANPSTGRRAPPENGRERTWGGRCRQSFPIGPLPPQTLRAFVIHVCFPSRPPDSPRPFHFVRRFCRVPEPNFHPETPTRGRVACGRLPSGKTFFIFIRRFMRRSSGTARPPLITTNAER